MPKFVPRQRKHKVRERLGQDGGNSGVTKDSNALEIGPDDNNEKEEKRKRMKDAIRAKQPVMSSKKKKRLDKYIVRPRSGCSKNVILQADRKPSRTTN